MANYSFATLSADSFNTFFNFHIVQNNLKHRHMHLKYIHVAKTDNASLVLYHDCDLSSLGIFPYF